MKKSHIISSLLFLFLLAFPLLSIARQLPVPGQVNMMDLGAHSCIPCKMMAPIMEKLTRDYEGKAVVTFIDVWENPDEAKYYKISSIPTQIFFDKEGKEVYRHQGFLAEEAIVKQLTKMGVAKPHEGQ